MTRESSNIPELNLVVKIQGLLEDYGEIFKRSISEPLIPFDKLLPPIEDKIISLICENYDIKYKFLGLIQEALFDDKLGLDFESPGIYHADIQRKIYNFYSNEFMQKIYRELAEYERRTTTIRAIKKSQEWVRCRVGGLLEPGSGIAIEDAMGIEIDGVGTFNIAGTGPFTEGLTRHGRVFKAQVVKS